MNALEVREMLEKCSYSRLEVARRMGIPYSTLSAKLNGYTPFKPEEIEWIKEIVRQLPRY